MLSCLRAHPVHSPGALLVIAPRQRERFDEVERLAKEEGFSVTRRSNLRSTQSRGPTSWCSIPSVSLRRLSDSNARLRWWKPGGLRRHNIPNLRFRQADRLWSAYAQLPRLPRRSLANRAAVQVQTDREPRKCFCNLVADPVRRAGLGAAARALVEANRGARTRRWPWCRVVAGTVGVVRPFRIGPVIVWRSARPTVRLPPGDARWHAR